MLAGQPGFPGETSQVVPFALVRCTNLQDDLPNWGLLILVSGVMPITSLNGIGKSIMVVLPP